MGSTPEGVTTSLVAGVAAAVLTSLFAKMKDDKKIRIANVTRERKMWRDSLRKLVAEINRVYLSGDNSKLQVLLAELEIRLNPIDPEDNAILVCLRYLTDHKGSGMLDELNERMALLLKYEWEKAKFESSGKPAVGMIALTLTLATIIVIAILCSCHHVSIKSSVTIYHVACVGFGSAFFLVAGLCLSCLIDHLVEQPVRDAHNREELISRKHKRYRCWARLLNRPFRIPYSRGPKSHRDVDLQDDEET